jgi:hypothetical protein
MGGDARNELIERDASGMERTKESERHFVCRGSHDFTCRT